MISIKINWKNEKEILDLMGGYPKQIDENVEWAFKTAMFQIERYAKMDAPVDTGTLRRDIKTHITQSKITNTKTRGVIFNNVKYSIYVHEGTYKMRKRPYLERAIYNRGEILLKRELERNLLKKKRGLI